MNQTTASPQPPNERADILDITRGFALLGICLAAVSIVLRSNSQNE